jgi:6-phosphogluconolactonase (cycloisomerase 2 family)
VAVDASGKVLVAAYCADGSFASYPIKDDGTIGAAAATVKFAGKGRASFANVSIDNRFLFVTDAAGDKIMVYKVDTAAAKVTANNPAFAAVKPGNAPLRFSFHPSSRFAYSLNEATSTVTVTEGQHAWLVEKTVLRTTSTARSARTSIWRQKRNAMPDSPQSKPEMLPGGTWATPH